MNTVKERDYGQPDGLINILEEITAIGGMR